ncbi:MAG: hypothetical protein JWM53_6330, partial [bacterium]|nr:hypothetical protein [bacterium]
MGYDWDAMNAAILIGVPHYVTLTNNDLPACKNDVDQTKRLLEAVSTFDT